MTNQTPADPRSSTDQILDLLLDALVERQKARRAGGSPATKAPSPGPEPAAAGTTEGQPDAGSAPAVPPPRPEPRRTEQARAAAPRQAAERRPVTQHEAVPEPGDEGWEPPPRQPSIAMGKTLGRLAILVVALILLVNIPVNRYGVSLARILPDSASLIIRDGLVLKGSGPEIYVLEDDKLRWISSLDAFDHLGLTWEDVHVVEDEFLSKFEKGRPMHVLLKCQASPHIYRLENQQKRWIKDIDTFLSEGHVWEDVRFVTCEYLRDLPDGLPIPEDAGPAPEP